MVPRVIRMLIKAFRVNLKKIHDLPPLKTKIPIWFCLKYGNMQRISLYFWESIAVYDAHARTYERSHGRAIQIATFMRRNARSVLRQSWRVQSKRRAVPGYAGRVYCLGAIQWMRLWCNVRAVWQNDRRRTRFLPWIRRGWNFLHWTILPRPSRWRTTPKRSNYLLVTHYATDLCHCEWQISKNVHSIQAKRQPIVSHHLLMHDM